VAATTKTRRTKTTAGAVVKDLVSLDTLRMDSDVQPREAINTQVIGEYAESMRNGDTFPDIIVFHDAEAGEQYLADGWHRVLAAREASKATLNAEIRAGTKRDAVLYSISANTRHGLRPTNADKRRAVRRLLIDPEWSQWSDGVIAQRAGVSQPFVGTLRSKMSVEDEDSEPKRRKTADGRTMDTTSIGRKKAEQEEEPETAEAEASTNGHAPISLVLDDDDDQEDAGAVEDDQDGATVEDGSVEAFAARFADVMLQLGDYKPGDVFAAMTEETRNALADKWDDIIGSFDACSGALEEALTV
jgi:hypothetical protein